MTAGDMMLAAVTGFLLTIIIVSVVWAILYLLNAWIDITMHG